MDAEQKKRLIKRYVKEKSATPQDTELSDGDLASFVALGDLLDYIDFNNQGLFDLTTLETDASQWSELTDIVNYAATFSLGYPPTLIKVSEQSADFGLRYWRNSREIKALPKDNYYARPTTTPPSADEELNQIIMNSREKLFALLKAFAGSSEFNPKDNTSIAAGIAALNEIMASITNDTLHRTRTQNILNIFLDLNKINQLEQIVIRQDNGSSLDYCILAETTAGVTQKISLISLSMVKKQLEHLNAQDGLTVESYNTRREHYKLSTDAIIKLPKHKDIREIQHEAMALNSSRILGLDTASSTTVYHNGQPALFVPFDKIRLLNEFAKGKTFKAGLGFTGKTYTHYSTISPVGAGIEADHFTSDFGNALALLYLCSDPDAIGGYCQNKALKDSKSLFIFDQVLMDTDKFILDSRLCLQPNQFIIKHTRHGQGRNKTLIEDSSMVSKFDSIMQLKKTAGKLIQYASHVAWQHENRIQAIKKALTSPLSTAAQEKLNRELIDVELLGKDAELIKNRIQERINQIDEILPKTTGNIGPIEMRQCLILEKLLHNPVLYSDDARPYKNPWTEKHSNPLQSIDELADSTVQINFKHKVSPEMTLFIRQRGGGDSLSIIAPKVMKISKAHLNDLDEGMLHPEHHLQLTPNTNYLAISELEHLKKAYGNANQIELINTITHYQSVMKQKSNTPSAILDCITNTELTINGHIHNAKDKGFGMHVLKKFYFDAQQQLQKLMNPALIPANLNQAFAAALKLDRVSEFNSVIKEAIRQNKLSDTQFTGFLHSCIHKETSATNYHEAQQESFSLLLDVQRVQAHLKLPVPPLIVQLKGQNIKFDGLRVEYDSLTKAKEEKENREYPVAAAIQEKSKGSITVSNSRM